MMTMTADKLEAQKASLLRGQGSAVHGEASRKMITSDAERRLALHFDELVTNSKINVRRNFLEVKKRIFCAILY